MLSLIFIELLNLKTCIICETSFLSLLLVQVVICSLDLRFCPWGSSKLFILFFRLDFIEINIEYIRSFNEC